LNGQRLPLDSIPCDVPKELHSLIKSCWCEEPDKRPSFSGKRFIYIHICINCICVYIYAGVSGLASILPCLIISSWLKSPGLVIYYDKCDWYAFPRTAYIISKYSKKLRTGNSIKFIFYGLAADRQEYCFTKDFIFFLFFFLNFFFKVFFWT